MNIYELPHCKSKKLQEDYYRYYHAFFILILCTLQANSHGPPLPQ